MQCPNISCGMKSDMCLDHDQVTGAPVASNPALTPAALSASRVPALSRPQQARLRLSRWQSARDRRAS